MFTSMWPCPMERMEPAIARAHFDSIPAAKGPLVEKVQDTVVAAEGRAIPIRIYTPKGQSPFGALIYFHGGGWVVGSIENADGTARHLACGAGSVVISVGYRLAPEHKFPAAVEDGYAAACWTAAHAKNIDVNPDKIAIGGASAGGNLAAAIALVARDRGAPYFVHQSLIYPIIERNFETRSYAENAHGPFLTRAMMEWYWKLYVSNESDAQNPYAAPILAADLRGLPPAFIITAEYDPLRDEGRAYADRLREAEVPVVYANYEGMIHGFFNMWSSVEHGRVAIAEVCRELRKVF
jgi:acetyl esterase